MPSTAVTVPIDWKQLHSLSDGNKEFEVELLKIFFVETKTQLQLLARAILESDGSSIEHLTHKIKGSSGNIGFLDLYQHASLLEHQVRTGRLTDSHSQIEHSQIEHSQIEHSQIEHHRLLDRMVQDLAMIQTFLEEEHSFSAVARDTD